MSSSSYSDDYGSSLESSEPESVCNSSDEFYPTDINSDSDVEENYIFPVKEYQWRSNKEEGDCAPLPFTSMPALKVSINSNSPLEMFEILFNNDLTNMIVTETNKKGNNLSQHAKKKYGWREVTGDEIKVMVATLIAQQLNYMVFLYGHPGYNEHRNNLIYKLMSFSSDTNANSAILKAKPLIDQVRRRFKEVYTPRQKLIIDERLTFVAKGPILAKNYNVLASYLLCESISGYIYNFTVRVSEPSPDTLDFELGYKADILDSLMDGLYGKGYHIYSANYYNSLEMALNMYDKKTGFVGHLRSKSKNIPSDLKDQKPCVGEGVYRYEKSGRMLVMKFNNKKNSYLVSTVHNGEDVAEEIKKKKRIVMPKVVADFLNSDENIQHDDYCLESFQFEKSKFTTTHRRIFRQILNFMVSNAYALHKINGGTLTPPKFKMHLVHALIGRYL